MRHKQTTAGELAQQICRKFPKAGSLTLAKRLHREHPEVYSSVEAARTTVRYYRGQHGAADRTKARRYDTLREARNTMPFPAIPEAKRHYENWGPEVVSGPTNVLVLSDLHIPYHDPAAIEVALAHGQRMNTREVVLLGDILDCHSVSKWVTDPRERDFAGEIKAVRQFLDHLKGRFPKSRVIYKEGNHEERFWCYMATRAPDLLGLDDFDLPQILRVPRENYVTDKRPLLLGKLPALHGHEYRFAIQNPVNPARGLFLRGKSHAMCGHFHQMSEHSENTLSRGVLATFSLGCLCDLNPPYLPLNNWCYGFATVEVDKDGAFQVNNHRIIDGKVY